MIHFLIGLAQAGDPGLRDFVGGLASPANSVTVCRGLDQIEGLPQAILDAEVPRLVDLDLAQPVFLAVSEDGTTTSSFVLRGGPRQTLVQPSDVGQSLGPASLLEPLLELPGPEGAGCLSLTSVPLPGGASFVLENRVLDGARSTARTHGLELPQGALEVWQSSSPRGRSVGRSTSTPIAVLRLNVDPEPLLRLIADEGGRAAPLAETLDKLEAGHVDLGVGAELALLPEGVVVAVPLRRPIRASWALRRMRRSLRAQDRPVVEVEDLLLVEEVLFVGAKGHALVVGVEPELVRSVLSGQGAPWLPPELADQPGLVALIDMDRLPTMAPMPGASKGIRGPSQVHADLVDGAFVAELWLPWTMNLIVGWLGPAITPPEPERDPVGSPPSTEALSVLMLLRQAEEQALADGGQYLPYSGGPRDLDQLDAQRVPWAGIPDLGIGPMETACRYEISLGAGGFTARSLCDEDGDGKLSITVVAPGALPARITPPDVR